MQSTVPSSSAAMHRLPIRLNPQRRIHLRIGVVIANRLVRQRKVVRRSLARHMQSLLLRLANRMQRLGRRHMLHMQMRPHPVDALDLAQQTECRAPQSATPPPPASRAAPAGTPRAPRSCCIRRSCRVSSACCDIGTPSPAAATSAARITSSSSTGLPSSVNPTAPARTSA